ncbi:MAG: hypothetical protein WA740_09755 [Candidatus Binataceae bacterium]
MRIALGNGSLASYSPGGGHWSWFLQYPLGLHALRHQVFWLELLKTSGDRARDLSSISDFFARIHAYDLEDCCALACESFDSAKCLRAMLDASA